MITLCLPVSTIRLLLFVLNVYRLTPAGMWRRRETHQAAEELNAALDYCREIGVKGWN